MEIDVSGRRIVRLEVGYVITFHLDDGIVIQLESPVRVTSAEIRSIALSCQAIEEGQLLLDDFVGAVIEDAVVDNSGSLVMACDTGMKINVQGGGEFEAWTMSWPDGRRLVSLPGGDLAIWDTPSQP